MRRYVIAGGVGLALLVAAYSAGRFSAPTKIHEVIVTQTVVKTVEKRVEAAARVIYVDRVITKEGEVREHIVTREVTKAETDHNESTNTTSTADKLTENDAPRLTVSVLVGAQLSPHWQPIPNAGPLALGAAVQYRIAGPFVIGAWGLDTGAFGGSVGLSF